MIIIPKQQNGNGVDYPARQLTNEEKLTVLGSYSNNSNYYYYQSEEERPEKPAPSTPRTIKQITNVDSGEISFNKEKTKDVLFNSYFSKTPDITITLDSLATSPPYRINASKDGFTIKLQIPYTGKITWTALEI